MKKSSFCTSLRSPGTLAVGLKYSFNLDSRAILNQLYSPLLNGRVKGSRDADPRILEIESIASILFKDSSSSDDHCNYIIEDRPDNVLQCYVAITGVMPPRRSLPTTWLFLSVPSQWLGALFS